MDNDGDLDIASSNDGVYISDRMFSIFKNERNGYYIEMPTIDGYHVNLSSIGDIDNDGDIDFSTGLPTDEVFIYNNNGYGRYQIDTSFNLWFSTVYHTLLDLNNDGFLDYLGIDKEGSVAINDGNGGFLAITGLGIFHEQENVILNGVSWGDPDNDGDFDFYGGYTSFSGGNQKNVCFLNDGNGSFVQFDPTSTIVEKSCFTPSANWVDYDNDGDMDLYINNIMCDNSLPALYENLGDMEFTKHDIIDEIYRHSHAVSDCWGDLDNDGDLDLFITVENNPFPFGGGGDTSATPYNLLYLNEGNGQFIEILEHPLTLEDSHTALLFDHDNDGDLDVLLTRYSWSNDGFINLFDNQGNDNSWIILTCEGTTSNRSAIGTRLQAKLFVNGTNITQTREITPIHGHASYANLRVHFGLGDADVIDTLIIRWPSGHVDTYLDVEANQFYMAIEGDKLEIDFKATNFIRYAPSIPDRKIISENETISIDLTEHFHFVKGDTLPEITGDTLTFIVLNNENPDVVATNIEDNILTLESGTENGDSEIQIVAKTDFTKRMERFTVSRVVGVNTFIEEQHFWAFPNPFSISTTLEYELKHPSHVSIAIYNQLGERVELIEETQSKGKQQIVWNAEGLAAGVYFCVLKTESGTQTTKMIKLE
jgi:hypothetical protein